MIFFHSESGKLYSFGCGVDGQLGHGNCEVKALELASYLWPLNHLHPKIRIYILRNVYSTFLNGIDEEKQELPHSAMISIILMTLMFKSVVVL